MKLGPSYWGEFYREIWRSGLRAFEGQNLLGMKVDLWHGATLSGVATVGGNDTIGLYCFGDGNPTEIMASMQALKIDQVN